MPARKKGHVKLVVFIPPGAKEEILREAKARRMTMGDLVVEAFQSRVVMVRKR